MSVILDGRPVISSRIRFQREPTPLQDGRSAANASTGGIKYRPRKYKNPAAVGVLSAKANNATVSETSMIGEFAANSFRM
jgi:hypothetical protein